MIFTRMKKVNSAFQQEVQIVKTTATTPAKRPEDTISSISEDSSGFWSCFKRKRGRKRECKFCKHFLHQNLYLYERLGSNFQIFCK